MMMMMVPFLLPLPLNLLLLLLPPQLPPQLRAKDAAADTNPTFKSPTLTTFKSPSPIIGILGTVAGTSSGSYSSLNAETLAVEGNNTRQKKGRKQHQRTKQRTRRQRRQKTTSLEPARKGLL
jgi:hypothetical protein